MQITVVNAHWNNRGDEAAHAFGVKDAGGSILRYGDLSGLSFHATKVFNTFEGGAIVCPDAKTKEHIYNLRIFVCRRNNCCSCWY
jgi:dTDP-4-amino-4,6-dideoxygalactose transaminase